jgi:hypothetical protein
MDSAQDDDEVYPPDQATGENELLCDDMAYKGEN